MYAQSISDNFIVGTGVGSADAGIEVGQGRTADGRSLIDLHAAEATYGDFAARIARDAGANGQASFLNRGTGQLLLGSQDAGGLGFMTSGTQRYLLTAAGDAMFYRADASIRSYITNTGDGASATPRYPGLNIQNYGGATKDGYPCIYLSSFMGTQAAPTAVINNQILGTISFNGLASASPSVDKAGARIRAVTEKDWTATDGSAFVQFLVNGPTGEAERMRLTSAGNLGIGTAAPIARFHAKHNSAELYFREATGNAELWLNTPLNVYADMHFSTVSTDQVYLRGSSYGLNVKGAAPRFAINAPDANRAESFYVNGTSALVGQVDVTVATQGTSGLAVNNAAGGFVRVLPNAGGSNYNQLVQPGDAVVVYGKGAVDTGSLVIGSHSNGNAGMRITAAGDIGIGTANPQSKLAVNGTITAKEVVVTLVGWSDSVFAADYRLPTLSEVRDFIARNRHLPGVPSEAEIVAKGAPIGDIQRIHMAKIEELTLYALAADDRVRALEGRVQADGDRIDGLTKQNEALQVRLERLEKALAVR